MATVGRVGPLCVLLQVGDLFERQLYERLRGTSCDAFGEGGEFHTLAATWQCTQPHALLSVA